MGSVSPEGNVSDRFSGAGGSNRLAGFEFNDKDVFGDKKVSTKNEIGEPQKVQRREEEKPKEPKSPVYDSLLSVFDSYATNGGVTTVVKPSMEVSSGHGFKVGDMVWAKVKSHPWWPGHVYSEEFATPSVRRSKREGELLVAFFGDSSYGWFDSSELVPFDSNFVEKSLQSISRTFVKAVEEAMDEVSKRSGLGLSCMCRNKKNFRQTDVQGFFAVDVADYDHGAVYSIDTIGKARDSFQPRLSLDFVRQLALEPTGSEHVDDMDFIKNKATVMSYRKAVYEEFDETYAQAFGQEPVSLSSGSKQDSTPGKKLSKAPLSGREVFADTLGKARSPAKPNKSKDHAKKDKYLFKRRDESKEIKMHQKEKEKVTSSPQPIHFEDPSIAASDYKLQMRLSRRDEQNVITVSNGESDVRDATGVDASMGDTPTVLEFSNPGFDMNTIKVESANSSSVAEVEEKKIVPEMEARKMSSGLVVETSSSKAKVFNKNDIPSSGPDKIVAQQRVVSEPKKVKLSKRPVGELGSGKSVLPEKKKKRKKESLTSDSTHIQGQEGFSLVDKVSANNPPQSALAPKPPIEGPHRIDGKVTASNPSRAAKTQGMMTGLANYEAKLPQILDDLHSLALDPFHINNRGLRFKVRQVFLRFRSVVFQKSLNSSLADGDANDTHSSKSPAINSATSGSENGIPVKPQARSSGRPDDPTKGGQKRGPSDRQEEIAAKRKKKIGDIKNLTKEMKVTKKTDEPTAQLDDRQAVVMPSRKLGAELVKKPEQRAPEPTMLMMKFPTGGSLPSMSELKARFARFGPMDHSGTRIYWNAFTCRVVYRHKTHAQAAYKFVVGCSALFGNTDVKCCLKEIGVVGSGESEPPLKVLPKEEPTMEERTSVAAGVPGLQLKSCLKKSGGEEGGGNGGRGTPRVKFMLTGNESQKNKKGSNGDGAFSSSHAMDFNSKNFNNTVLRPTSTAAAQFTRPPPLPLPPPSCMRIVRPPPPPRRCIETEAARLNMDVAQQMLSLMTKCKDVVTNVTGLLGYVPYHSL